MKVLLLLIAVFTLVLWNTLIIYVSWNTVMPDLFHLPTIEFWQSFWLAMLCGALFKQSNVKLNDLTKE